jgi:hypothetical protein
MTPKRTRALEALRAGEWSTMPELSAWLGQTHTEALRVAADLVRMGKAKRSEGGRAVKFEAV